MISWNQSRSLRLIETSIYTAGLSGGVAGGIVVSGLITISHGWRTIYYVAMALVGGVTLLVILTMPETAYTRDRVAAASLSEDKVRVSGKEKDQESFSDFRTEEVIPLPKNKTYLQRLTLFSGQYTNESLLMLFIRPVGLLFVPQVLWATLVISVLIGFLVAIASNFATAFSSAYQFKPYQSGLCFIAAFIGSLIGIAFGGILTDKIADFFTRRNGGLREPEMRLPAIFPSMICGPLALLLYGVGIDNKLHWMVPALGLGLCNHFHIFLSAYSLTNISPVNFSIVQGVNVTFVYTVDSYRPIGGEVMVTQLAFKGMYPN